MRALGKVALFAVALAPGASVHAAADVPGLRNARAETRTARDTLGREVERLLAADAGPFWIGYAVPSTREHTMCCWQRGDGGDESCGGCRLEGDEGSGFRTSKSEVPPEGPATLRVLLRGQGGRVTKVRMVSEGCALDAGGVSFVWLEGVKPVDSVAFLEGLASSPAMATREHGGGAEIAVGAIAYTADPAADAALDRLLAAGRPEALRKKAAFWLGQSRRPNAVARLVRLLDSDGSPRFREHVVFALSQTGEQAAIDKIIAVAKRDDDAHVRGQALFWLAQTASRRAASTLEAAATEDPEVEVKKKAVFALSQLPRDEGVPLLMKLARTHQNREVRKQAMFWLGQSGDPRALAFFEDVLRP